MRKPVQVSISSDVAIVICDDGSLWRLTAPMPEREWVWSRLPEIPQEVLSEAAEIKGT